jgi:Tol biopolymer transport system component
MLYFKHKHCIFLKHMTIKHISFKRRTTIIFVVSFGLLGLVLLLQTFASTSSVPIEPEVGNTTSPAITVTDSSASGGQAINFVQRGKYIIYSSNAGGTTTQIWRMKADGTEGVRLTNDLDNEHTWVRPSPDGKNILFVKADKGKGVNDAGTNRLWMMNADGSNQREVLNRSRYGWDNLAHTEWSPDSSRIVLANGSYLTTIKPDGSDPVRIAQPTTIDGQVAYPGDPSWSEDGSIMFLRKWECFGPCNKHDLFRLNLTTGQETRVTTDAKVKWDPYLSPDGNTYLWVVWNPLDFFTPGILYKGSASGNLNPTALTTDGIGVTNGVFSADSKKVLFLRNYNFGFADLQHSVHTINLDGTGLTRISRATTSTGEGSPAYWP